MWFEHAQGKFMRGNRNWFRVSPLNHLSHASGHSAMLGTNKKTYI